MNSVLPILNSRIPASGRRLTITEIRAVRAAGYRNIPATAFVSHGTVYRGYLYRPVLDGSLAAIDITVCTKEGVK